MDKKTKKKVRRLRFRHSLDIDIAMTFVYIGFLLLALIFALAIYITPDFVKQLSNNYTPFQSIMVESIIIFIYGIIIADSWIAISKELERRDNEYKDRLVLLGADYDD